MTRYSSPAALRNIQPIGDVLSDWLPRRGVVLEVASGSGEHGLAFAQRFAHLQWQPTDPDAAARASIAAWQRGRGAASASDAEPTDVVDDGDTLVADADNFLPPLSLDAALPDWPVTEAAAVMAINMVHISPWSATLGLLAGAQRVLPAGGPLILYGPYWEMGVDAAISNLTFDNSLRARNRAWGIRRLDEVQAAAQHAGLAFQEKRTMPANNLMLLFRKLPD